MWCLVTFLWTVIAYITLLIPRHHGSAVHSKQQNHIIMMTGLITSFTSHVGSE